MGGAAALLSARRRAALLALVGGIALWPTLARPLPELGTWGGVAVAAVLLIPGTLAVAWVALPLADAAVALLVGGALGLAVGAVAADLLALDGVFDAAKLCGLVLAGYAAAAVVTELWLVVVLALVIPWVDALSVWRGPTRVVVDEHPALLERISVTFRLPGGEGSVGLGPPDVLFLALFLAVARHFELRVAATWACTMALLGVTLAAAVAFDLGGLPALPAVALGFLLPNADLLWARRGASGS